MLAAALRRLLGRLAALLTAALRATWRVRVLGAEHRSAAWSAGGGGPPLYAFFHGQLLLALAARPERGMGVMVSRSRDGEIAAAALAALGLSPVRGSIGGGGAAALVGLVHRVRAGVPVCAAIDGSRGPRYSVLPGLLHVASRTARPILPFGASARPAWIFARSWDGFTLPLPFARVVIAFEAPLQIARGGEAAAATELRLRMVEATNRTRAALALSPIDTRERDAISTSAATSTSPQESNNRAAAEPGGGAAASTLRAGGPKDGAANTSTSTATSASSSTVPAEPPQ